MKHRQIHLNRLERLLLFVHTIWLIFWVITAKKLLENRFHVLKVWKCNIRTLLFKIERHLKTLYTFYEAINSFTNILARVLSIHVCTSTWVMAFVMRIGPTILDQNCLWLSKRKTDRIQILFKPNYCWPFHSINAISICSITWKDFIVVYVPDHFCSIFSLFIANIKLKWSK